MELAEAGGNCSREELLFGGGGSFPDLWRGFSEVERFRVGFGFMERFVFPPFGSLRSSTWWSGSERSCHGSVRRW
ncbi:hypothetical protein F2Q70_00039921 [Brassica cretica]|uniref:Uncharacterized protein n=1 Tax=Brassica cretica TaxID=69181 RepID=A0A8S9K1Z0_BRACR|nr:hypothetical protein F2Q70_00039921 [Brassica cretica]